MTAVAYNTVIDQGADWFITFIWKDPAGVPIDMVGYTAALQLRSYPASPTAVLSLSTQNNGITIIDEDGQIDVHATNQQTAIIDEGVYFYDLEVTDVGNGGTVTRLSQGQITVSAQVTR
jgi:hypothetical protein